MPRPLYPHTRGFRPFGSGGPILAGTTWNLAGATFNAATNTLTATAGFGNARASSQQAAAVVGLSGLLLVMEFGHNEVADYGHAGVSNTGMAENFNILRGVEMSPNGVRVMVNGTSSGYPFSSFSPTDRCRIEVYPDSTVWKVNGEVLFTLQQATPTTAPLFLAASPYYETCAFTNVLLGAQQLVTR